MALFRIENLPSEDQLEFFQRFLKFIELSRANNDDMTVNAFEARAPLETPAGLSNEEAVQYWENVALSYSRQAERVQELAEQLNAMAVVIRRNIP